MIAVFVNLSKKLKIWQQLENHQVNPKHLEDHHFLVSHDGNSDRSAITSFLKIDEIAGQLREATGLIINLAPTCPEAPETFAKQLCAYDPQFFIHEGDSESGDAGRVEATLQENDKSVTYYKHAVFDENWKHVQSSLVLKFQLDPSEIFHWFNGVFELARAAIDSYEEGEDLLSIWDRFEKYLNKRREDENIDLMSRKLFNRFTMAIDSDRVSEVLGDEFSEFESLCQRFYELFDIVFPPKRPDSIPEEKVEELSDALDAWFEVGDRVRENL